MQFIDTSVLLPCLDYRDRDHQAAARVVEKFTPDSALVTVNVLGELYVGLTRKRGIAPPLLTHREARAKITDASTFLRVEAVTPEQWELARGAKERFEQWGIWDALHWAAAVEFGCNEILTLDAPGGLSSLAGVRFVNPFA